MHAVVILQEEPPQKFRHPIIQIQNRRRGKDLLTAMGTTVQSVVISNTVYVGGGSIYNDLDIDKCTVMKLDLHDQQNEWTKLPQYSAKYFAMTSLANHLILVGGHDLGARRQTNQIAVFEQVNERWIHPYPPMKIARRASTSVCFNCYIIVAGGYNGQNERISSVEVMDTTLKRWYFAESLPNPRSALKSTLTENTLYLMGGLDHTNRPTRVVHKVDLNELITKATSNQATPTIWEVIEETPLEFSTPLGFRGSLLAVGGRVRGSNPSSSIHLYQPETRRWVKAEGGLPIPLWNCTCSILPSGDRNLVIVAGGQIGSTYCLTAVSFITILFLN